MGTMPDGIRAEWLGWYEVFTGKPISTKNKMIDGRPVYAKKGEASKLIWYNKKSGRWYAGKARALGKAAGVLHVSDVAATPDKVSSKWQVWVGPKRGWVEAPLMRAADDAQGRAIVDADAKALSDAAASIRLVGTTPQGVRHEWLGIYERRRALVGGRPSYVKKNDDTKLLWYYAASGTWFMGGEASLGKAKGVLQSHDSAVVPELIHQGSFLVGQGQGLGWVSAPELRFVHGAEADATNLADIQRLQTSARTIFLFDGRQFVGTQVLPANTAPAWQGAYVMDATNATEGGRARYVKAGDDSGRATWALWYDQHAGAWLLGRQGKRRALTKTMLSVYDGALLPDQIKSAWRKWVPGGTWEPATVRCLIGVEGAAVMQEQSAASNRILASSASTVLLVGLNGQRHEWLGSYSRRAGSLVNGRHSFVHEHDGTKMMWYDDRSASWRVGTHEASYGHEARFHPNKAVLRAVDPALVPERVVASWMLRASDDTHGGEDEAWLDAKAVRCIAGQEVDVEHQARAREIRQAGSTVYLAGAMPPSSPPGILGAYDLQPLSSGDKDWARRTYVRRGDAKLVLSYRPKTGDWTVERSSGTASQQRGDGALLLSVYNSALLPEHVGTAWRSFSAEGYWEDAPNLKCRAGAEGKASMDADLAAVSLQRALTPGWFFNVRVSTAVEQTKLALETGLQPWRIRAVLEAAKTKGVKEAALEAARKVLPIANPPAPPPPLPTPVASPVTSPALSPPPPPKPTALPPPEVEDAVLKKRRRKKSRPQQKAVKGRKRKGKGKKDRGRKKARKAKKASEDEEEDDPDAMAVTESMAEENRR